VRIFLLVDRIDEWEKVLKLPAAESCGLREYYLARRPYRALLVARHGLRLGDCMNRHVDANAGVDRADPGFARVPGEQQSKITLYRIVSRNRQVREKERKLTGDNSIKLTAGQVRRAKLRQLRLWIGAARSACRKKAQADVDELFAA
jgi:hypothetical protein